MCYANTTGAPPRAIIFDLDGTLVDSLDDIACAMNRALQESGFPPASRDRVRARTGWGLRRLIQLSMPDECATDEKLLDRLLLRTREAYHEHPVVHTHPYDGIPALLDEVKERGIPSAVLSNKVESLVVPIVETVFPHAPFAHVLGLSERFPGKPDPTSARWVIDQFGVTPDEVAFVGDSEVDLATAHRAGCRSIAVLWGFRSEELLAEAQADVRCADIHQLSCALGLS